MPFVANFTASQNYGAITMATLTDTSTGTDVALTMRLVYIQKQDGSYLVPQGTTTDYVIWPISDSSIDIDILNKDYCLEITVVWYVGTGIGYTKTYLCLFTAYSELFLRQLTQAQEANPNLINNANFWTNKQKLRTLVDDATQATAYLNDQTISTFCLNEAKKLTDNPQVFY